MVLPPGCYEATIKDKVDKQKETNHIPKQDGFLYHVMRNKPPLPSEEISYDPYTIPQNLTPLVYGEASAGMHLSNISLQTGEEFAWQFSQEASQIQKAFSVEKVLASKGNFSNSKWSNPNAYEDITSIHGVGQINSGGDLEKSFTGVEQSSSKNSEGTFSSGLIESTQSFKNEGWHSHSDLQAPFQQVSHASTHRSSFSEQSKVSSLSKVKFMCSFGGKFLPRPSDGRLRYVGGETHLVSVNRDINYDSLMHKALRIYGQGLILKYQLPGEGLDALVSVSCDEDVENMMEEYQKMANSNENFKLRIFLFDSLGHDFGHFNILADKKVSEQLYVNAVNGIRDSAQEKLAECIGTMTSQCAENQNGLQFAVEQYENQVEPVLWDSSLQKRPRGTEEIIPREESCTKIKMPVSANPYGSSSLSSTCFPFISPAVEDFQVSAVPMSVLPVDTVHSALQSGTQFNYPHDLFSNHFRTSGQEEKISPDEQGMSKDILVNQHLDSLIRSFSETGQEGDQKVTDTNISRHVLDNMKMQLQDEFEHKQCTLDPTLRDFTSDWTCVSQVSDTVHGQLHQHIMDRSLYGVFHAAYTPISCGVTQQSSVEQDISQALYHNKEPHLTNHECGESLTFEIGQPSHIESLGVLQPINLVVNDNFEQSNFNQKSSSTPSQNFVEDLTNARLSEDVSIANEEPSGQKENNDEWSSRGFVSLASNQSSEHSSEQTQSLENYEKQYSQRIQEAQTHCQQVLPHVKSDTVLQAHIKSAEEMSKSNNVSQGRHSESSLGIMPSQNALHSSQKLLPQVQNFEDADNESTFTSSTSSGNQPLFPQPLCKHKNRTNLEESSSIHSYFSEPAQSGLSLQEGRDSEVNYVKSTRTCQSEGEGDERISDLLWGSDADPPVSFSRIKSSGDIDTFISSSLEEPFQTFQTYGNAGHQKVHVPSENKEIKDVPNYKSVKIKDEPDNILQESAANFCSMDFLSDSSVQTGEANDNNLVSTSSNLSLPLADGEDHSTSCTSEKWWAETVLKSSSCNHDADVNTSGRRKSSSNVAGDDLNTHLYEGIPLFGKSLMDEDIVEAYKVSGISVPKIEGFQDSCSDSLVVNAANDPSYQNADFPTNENSISGFSLNGSITKAAMGGIDVHGNFDAESNGPVQSLTDSMACSVNLTFTATSSTAEHDWELLRKNARVKVDISTGIGSEIMGEESIAIQDLDIEESKIEYSDKDDEPDSDAAIAESEAIARGLQIIKNGDLEELRELGCGTFGTVLYGKWRGSDVAIKRIKNSIFIGTPSMQDRLRVDFWREACILSQLHHPNVLAFYGVVPDGPGGTLATVTEYMVNGSLKQVLQRKDRPLDRRKRWLITMDAAFGMEYLHSKNIVHFDLKCENLLVNMRDSQRPICKVGDLGLSKVKQHTLVSGGVRGTLPWMAPELLNGSSCMVSEKVDVFSFGIVMWELLTGEEPYANMHYGAIIGGIVSNTLRPSVPSWCDPAWRTLMEQCWSADPAERPSFTEIANRLRSTAQSFHSKAQHSHAQVYHS